MTFARRPRRRSNEIPEFPNFCGGAYRLATDYASVDRALNCYPEILEKGPRAGKPRLVGIPGLRLFTVLPSGPIRCLWGGDNRLFAVAGSTLWELTPLINNPLGAPINNGNVGPGPNPAIIVSNGFQLCIASGGALYIDAGANAVPLIDTEGFPLTCATVAFQDQYFIAAYTNTKTVIISNLAPDGGTWDPGNEAEKEGYSDNIVRVWVDQPGGEYLWLFGNQTTEVWMDTGGLFPFSRVQSCVFPIGCDSAWSVAGAEGQRFWLWNGVVWGASGFQPVRVSDFGVEQAISTYSFYDQINAEAFCYIDGGHLFYVLSFPQSGATWVYDATMQSWHERWYLLNGQLTRYRPRVFATTYGLNFVGDYASGAVFIMDPTVYVDAPPVTNLAGPGVPLLRQRVCPYITDNMKNLRVNRLTVDAQVGVGLNVPKGQPGYDPQAVLRYSKNRGETWSSQLSTSLGRQGEYNKRVIYTQLGSSRIGWAAEYTVTDPVAFSVQGAEIDVSPSTWPRP